MGSVQVVEGLPLLEAVVEQPGVVDHDALEYPVELLLVDPLGTQWKAIPLLVRPTSQLADHGLNLRKSFRDRAERRCAHPSGEMPTSPGQAGFLRFRSRRHERCRERRRTGHPGLSMDD